MKTVTFFSVFGKAYLADESECANISKTSNSAEIFNSRVGNTGNNDDLWTTTDPVKYTWLSST